MKMSKESSLGSQFESVLIPKIYTYACVEESQTIKRLQEELDEYKDHIRQINDDLLGTTTELLVCEECYHRLKFCPTCYVGMTIPCKWCFPNASTFCESCEKNNN
jgi:hypothetical protein